MKSKFNNLALTTTLSMALSAALCVQAFALSGIQTASVDYSAGLKAEVLLANNQIHSAQAASSMISSNSGVQMALNGAFFDSYTGTSQVYGAIIQDGQVINGGGENNMIGFTYDGKVLIDRVKISPLVKLANGKEVTAWGVNVIYTDSKAVAVMTDEYDKPFSIPAGAKTFTISGGKVIAESSDSSQTVQDGTIKLVYNSGALSEFSQWGLVPSVGQTATYTHTIAPSGGNAAWANVQTAVAGGRLLVLNGQNVAASETYNSKITAADQAVNVSAQRSYAYTTSDGKLYFETASGTFNEIASHLVSKGAVNAVNLDGGASSMLYNNGSYLTSAGRNLSNILAIVPNTGSTTSASTATTVAATPAATATSDVAPAATTSTTTTNSNGDDVVVTLSTSYDPKMIIVAPVVINSTTVDPVTGAVTRITTDPATGVITKTVTG